MLSIKNLVRLMYTVMYFQLTYTGYSKCLKKHLVSLPGHCSLFPDKYKSKEK